MGISLSLILLAVGAIMRFAVSADTTGWDMQTTGLILMAAGALGIILSLVFWSSWGGFGRRTTVVEPGVEQERIVHRETEIR